MDFKEMGFLVMWKRGRRTVRKRWAITIARLESKKNNGAIKGYKEKSDWGEMRRKDGELPMGCDSFWTMVMGTCQKNMQRATDLSWSRCPRAVVWSFNDLCILYHSVLFLFTVLWILRSKSTTATTFLWRPVNKGYWASTRKSCSWGQFFTVILLKSWFQPHNNF